MMCNQLWSLKVQGKLLKNEIGNFSPKIGKKYTFYDWENSRLTAIKLPKKNPLTPIMSFGTSQILEL